MPGLIPLIIHERLGFWARQLRPRLADAPVRIVETRSAADLCDAAGRPGSPILLLDLGERPRTGLEDLDLALQVAPRALSLVLDPNRSPGLAALAREIGAMLVIQGPALPPAIMPILTRWVQLQRRRIAAEGWSGDLPGDSDPIGELLSGMRVGQGTR